MDPVSIPEAQLYSPCRPGAESGSEQVVGSDMLIDDYDMDEKQDVAIITPAESPEEPEAEPVADDCE